METGDTVYDVNGTPQTLGEVLGKGGEGTVFRFDENPKMIGKIYHEKVLEERGEILAEKLQILSEKKSLIRRKDLGMPQVLLYHNGNVIGFAGRIAPGKTLALLHPQVIISEYPWLNRTIAVMAAIKYIAAISALHKADIVVGDVNRAGAMLDTESQDGSITLIDLDSPVVSHGKKVYFCNTYTAEFASPEVLISKDYKTAFSKASDAFSAAIVIFMLLNGGRHPYDQISTSGQRSDFVKAGKFPYVHDKDGDVSAKAPKGPWYRYWDHLSYRLKGFFISMFSETAHHPENRPNLDELTEYLWCYLHDIKKGRFTEELFPTCSKKQMREQSTVQ